MASILFVSPSYFHHADPAGGDEIKSPLLLLASYLAQHHEVEYLDFEVLIGRPAGDVYLRRYLRRVKEILAVKQFDILAISCWTSLSYQATMATARIVRELYPDRLIVVGGYHAMARPEDFVTADHLIDYVIKGEGEISLKEIADGYSTQGRPTQTVIVDSPPLEPEQYVPMNWDLVGDSLETHFPNGIGTLCVFLSRGCPFECSFCIESLKDRSWRPCTPEQAIDEIGRAIKRYKIKAIALGDACFGVRASWRKEFLRRLVDLAPEQWTLFETRPEYLDDDDIELLSKLKIEIQFGVESCSPQMLTLMKKSSHPDKFLEKFREVSHRLSQNGVVHGANLIFNHPGETQQTLEETFAFVDRECQSFGKSSLFWASHSYMHFPGSEVDRNQSEYTKNFGTQFLAPQWWLDSEDPFISSRKVIPSHDLSGERVDLWKKMYRERSQQLKDALTDEAFAIAAQAYFPEWQSDPRYQKSLNATESP